MTHSNKDDAATSRRKKRKGPRQGPRQLSMEPLEDRRLRAVFTVSNLNDSPVVATNDAPGTLRQAVFDANHTAGDDTILFAAALTSGGPATINLSSAGQLSINSNVTITGPGANLLSVRAYDPTPEVKDGQGSRVLEILSSGEASLVTIQGLTLTGGDVMGHGGGIRTEGALTLIESKITNNGASGTDMASGGGIAISANGSADVTDSTVSGNSVQGDYSYGGGISATTGVTVKLTDSTVSGNSVLGDHVKGGGISAADYLSIVRSLITGNKVDGATYSYGGGIAAAGQAIVSDSQITTNDALINGEITSGDSVGGGIDSRSILILSGSTISGNRAALFGGGISADNSTTISNSTIEGNSGDGVHSDGTLTVSSSYVVGNTTSGITHSGGLFVANSSIRSNQVGIAITTTIAQGAAILDSTVTANVGGGGIKHVSQGGPEELLEITNSTVSGNSGLLWGGISSTGGIALNGSTVSSNLGTGVSVTGSATIVNSTISNNTGENGGGVSIAIAGAQTAAISHSTITANRASFAGGGTHVTAGSTVTLDHTIVAGNLLTSLARQDVTGGLSARYSLIGDDTGAAVNDLGGNLIGHALTPIDPLLGPLADNGGLTLTHVPQVGSPVVDAGDLAAMAGSGEVPDVDQRGGPFARVVDGKLPAGARIDVGAVEWQAHAAPELIGDANRDGSVDAADYTLWRNTLNAMVEPYSGADFDGSGKIDASDYPLWKSNFGETLESMGRASGGGSLAVVPLEVAPLAAMPLATSPSEAVVPLDPSLFDHKAQASAPKLMRSSTSVRATADDDLLAWLTAQDERRDRRLAEEASVPADGPNSTRSEPVASQGADAVFDLLGGPDFVD